MYNYFVFTYTLGVFQNRRHGQIQWGGEGFFITPRVKSGIIYTTGTYLKVKWIYL